ncbi:MAG: dihydromonapterin reductase [Hahellaceae bacterium]|nr:dihydromonapterin reductase [Hahellaceae bacterium]MCP5211400.1 dihydromonapterin reductase [Hahellaceae bacterium]
MSNRETILITGAGQRVGKYLAEQFLALEYRVIITYRTDRADVKLLQEKGAIALQADFSSQQGVMDFITSVRKNTDSLRAIIHNASTWSKDKTVIDNPLHFNELVNVHMFAPYWINYHCRDLLEVGDGLRDIISLTDFTIRKGSDKHIAYLATKSALESMTLSFAKSFAPQIKVNAIAPALIMFNEGDDDAYKHDRLKRSALQIEPGAKVVFEAVSYLMHSSYTTGVILPLDGGRHLV